jgi:twitching motility protein PilT
VAKIDRLFDELLTRKGSQLHVGVGHPPLVRVRDELVPTREEPVSRSEVETLLYEIASPAQKRKIDTELDLDFAYAYENKARFRANYFMKTTGPAGVFRLIPRKIASLADLGCPDAVRGLTERRSGLVLVGGPSASGKSTTLGAMIDHVNATRACHILTVEDPVELVHEPNKSQITHREIGVHAPSFAAALRNASREDAQVVLVGELRDAETTKLALGLAGQGILVFAAVHATGAAAAVERVVSTVPADAQSQVRAMLAASLAGVVALRLLHAKGGGAPLVAFEILLASGAISALVREGKAAQIPAAMQAGQGAGMQTMDMALERLLGQGVLDPQAALDAASDKETFARVVARTRPDLVDAS